MGTLSIWHNVFFHKDVGPDATHIMGLPGTGKSQLANRIVKYCLEKKNENFVLAGDINCEWANVAPFAKEVEIILPHNVDVEQVNIKYDHQTVTEYNDLNIMDYFNEDTKGKILVVYDEHLFGKLRTEKTKLWTLILQQLLYRKILRRPVAIGMLFHEGSVVFPRQPVGTHWEAVMDFASLMVGARKNWVRLLFVSQLEKHIINLIRDLCLWRIQRKGKISKMDNAKALASSTPFLALDEFNMSFGGIYRLQSKVEKLEEFNQKMQMIPDVSKFNEYFEYYSPKKGSSKQTPFDRDKVMTSLYRKGGFTYKELGELFLVSTNRACQIIKSSSD